MFPPKSDLNLLIYLIISETGLWHKKKKRRLSKNKINRPLAERISKNILDSNFLIYRGRGEGSQNTLKSMEE
jgi:hypothetical protein